MNFLMGFLLILLGANGAALAAEGTAGKGVISGSKDASPGRVEQISRGVFKVNPGSLLTALQRLERAGWLDAEWRQTQHSRQAKFYSLTRAGRRQLEIETADWTRRAAAVARLLRAEA